MSGRFEGISLKVSASVGGSFYALFCRLPTKVDLAPDPDTFWRWGKRDWWTLIKSACGVCPEELKLIFFSKADAFFSSSSLGGRLPSNEIWVEALEGNPGFFGDVLLFCEALFWALLVELGVSVFWEGSTLEKADLCWREPFLEVLEC